MQLGKPAHLNPWRGVAAACFYLAVVLTSTSVDVLAKNQESCNATALNQLEEYEKAYKVVMKVPAVKNWMAALPADITVRFGAHVDKQSMVGGRCFWSVSVYENYPDRLRLWHAFLVQRGGNRILVQDWGGEYVPLSKFHQW